jgi:hypothetical protein
MTGTTGFNVIPENLPSAAAEFEKPYMEFEYRREVFRLENLRGGHNGRDPDTMTIVEKCANSPPQWDEERQRWVIPLTNNMINIDLSSQEDATERFALNSPLRAMSIISNPRNRYKSTGNLVSAPTSREEPPRYPIDCVFNMHIRVRVPGRGSLINVRPFQLVANGLTGWPPPVGTVYTHEDTVELFPEWVPFGERLLSPVARILPGDETIIINIREVTEGSALPIRGIIPTLQRFINRVT